MFEVGQTRIQKIFEMNLNGITFGELLPAIDPDERKLDPDWIPDGTTDDEGHAFLSVHSWLVHHDGRIILVDTGVGNDKSRPDMKAIDHLDNPFLDRLRHAGIGPEKVDLILHTHIHADHVGWNTRLDGDQWVPTFPNATVIFFSGLEWRYGAALAEGDADGVAKARQQAGPGEPVHIRGSGIFDDSMRPLDPAGRVRLIEVDENEVRSGIRFVPSPGHGIDHASIEIGSEGWVALFGGDILHHPVELHETDLV